jgi:glycosyltransferase involved in cell wall biosynthesis
MPSQLNSVPASICIVSHNAYGAMSGGHSGHIGGVEWQTSLLAKWLAQRGCNTSILTWDEGGPPVEVIDGVRVIKIAPRRGGIKGLRFFHPKWTGLAKAMRLADADVYYHNCAEDVTGQIALWCRRHNRAFVFSSACDSDCDWRPCTLSTPWELYLYRYGLRAADVRIVQTENQRRKLEENYGLDSAVIPMPCLMPAGTSTQAVSNSSKRVLWIARGCQQKRPDLLLDLAQACPEIAFDMVGPFYADDYAQNVLRRSQQVANVTAHGAVTRDTISEFYRNAVCLCCTSDFEGFPNTFLEAWSYGLPIVSTFDPDGLIARRNLGIVAHDVPGLATALKSLLSSPDRYLEMSQNSRAYFLENHRPEMVLPKFEAVFNNLFSSALCVP